MQREITNSIIEYGEIVVENGTPKIVSSSTITVLGKVSMEQANRIVRRLQENKGKQVTVFNVNHETNQYKLSIEKFLEVATLVEDEENEQNKK